MPRARHDIVARTTYFARPLALAVSLVAALIAPARLRAQVVRGTTIEQTSESPLVGVVVELTPAMGGERVASALTDPAGGFALRAPSPGRYVVTAKRIGVKRWSSPPLDLAAGETKTLRIVLEALDYRLPEVVVTTAQTLCAADPAQGERVAALWEEARTALDATHISLRDRLFAAEVTRYVRELDPKSRRVVGETRSETRAVVASPYRSVSADSLSARGYWWDEGGGKVTYHGPDAEVLMSERFLAEHCFRVVERQKGRNGLIGLAFAPVQGRAVPEVKGALWLDARTFELRLVDFSYDRFAPNLQVDSTALGGEVHFARLANGAWLVRRWFLRFPVTGRPTQPLSTEGSSPWVLLRPTSFRLAEEGGLVVTDEQRAPVRPAALEGVLRDSTGKRPLAGTVVQLASGATTLLDTTDAAGRFAFAALPPGEYRASVELPGYAALGLAAADQGYSLGDGESRRVELSAFDMRSLTKRLCGDAAPFGYATLIVKVRDAKGGAPVVGAMAAATWQSSVGRSAGETAPRTVEATTGTRGSAALCVVAAEREVKVTVKRSASGGASVEKSVRLVPRAVTAVEMLIGDR